MGARMTGTNRQRRQVVSLLLVGIALNITGDIDINVIVAHNIHSWLIQRRQ
jgi:hypothetical protein